MAYDAPDYQHVLWDSTGPYWKTASGKKTYIPPATGMSMFDDPQMIAWAKSKGFWIEGGRAGLEASQQPIVGADGKVTIPPSPVHMGDTGGDFLHNRGTWNSDTGQYDNGLNWGNILSLAVGGAIAAPFAAAALSGAAAGGAGGGAAGAAGGAAAGGAEAGTLASSVIAPTFGALPSVAASGAVPAALGGAAAAVPAAATAATLPSSTIAPAVGTLPNVAASGAVDAATALPSATVAPTFGALPNVAPSGAVPSALAPATAAASSGNAGLIKLGVSAAQNVVGNLLQKKAIGQATDAQVAAAEKALAAETAANNRAIDILSPWATTGAAASNRLGTLLHLTPPPTAPTKMPVTPAQQSAANTWAATATQGGQPLPKLTTIMQAPDGSTREVPNDHVAALEAKGAKRVAA